MTRAGGTTCGASPRPGRHSRCATATLVSAWTTIRGTCAARYKPHGDPHDPADAVRPRLHTPRLPTTDRCATRRCRRNPPPPVVGKTATSPQAPATEGAPEPDPTTRRPPLGLTVGWGASLSVWGLCLPERLCL